MTKQHIEVITSVERRRHWSREGVEISEGCIVWVEVFGAPPFGKLGVPFMSGIG
ncbi:hypothetical protein ACVIRO_007084 [Rhizobium ruizarguesonis]